MRKIKPKGYYLLENKALRYPIWLCFVDTETITVRRNLRKRTKIPRFIDAKVQLLRIGYAEIWRKKKVRSLKNRVKEFFVVGKIGEYYIIYYKVKEFYFFTREQFLKTLLKTVKKNENVWVLAYNMSFDYRILYNKNLFERYLELQKWIIDSQRFYIKFKRKDAKGKVIFADVMHYVGGRIKLEDLAKKLGLTQKLDTLKKYNYDVASVPINELKEYVKQDVVIIREYILNFIKYIFGLGSWKLTLAGVSFSIFRHSFMKKKPVRINDENYLEWVKKAYFGGRTEVFDLNIHYNVYYLDFNSLYPYVMREYRYPVSLKFWVRAENLNEAKNLVRLWNLYRKRGYLYIIEGLIWVPCGKFGFLPIRDKKGKVRFVCGYVYGVYASPEIELVIQNGGYVEYIKALAVYDSDYLFRNFVEHFYQEKLKAKEKGDKIAYWNSKIIMNSLYGKFAQRITKYQRLDINISFDDGVYNFEDLGEVISIGGKLYYKDTEGFAKLSIPEIAVFVTSYARAELLKAMLRAKDVVYCDTDSLVVHENTLNKLKDLIDEKELGKLKVEFKAKVFKAYKPKDYVVVSDSNTRLVKLKGIRKSAQKIYEDEKTRIFKQERGIGFRESLRYFADNGEIPMFFLEEQKEFHKDYDKGLVTPRGQVVPYFVDFRLLFFNSLGDKND